MRRRRLLYGARTEVTLLPPQGHAVHFRLASENRRLPIEARKQVAEGETFDLVVHLSIGRAFGPQRDVGASRTDIDAGNEELDDAGLLGRE